MHNAFSGTRNSMLIGCCNEQFSPLLSCGSSQASECNLKTKNWVLFFEDGQRFRKVCTSGLSASYIRLHPYFFYIVLTFEAFEV